MRCSSFKGVILRGQILLTASESQGRMLAGSEF
jgi:hypothetical protein